MPDPPPPPPKLKPIQKSNLQNGIQYRTEPKLKWEVIKELGGMGGGLNGGIAIVRTANDTYGRKFIEKRFNKEDIEWQIAHKEIAFLHQVGDHPYIPRLYDHFVDDKAVKASMYMEYCDRGSLEEVAREVKKGKRLNEHKLWLWLIQAMDALVYCHRGPDPEDDKKVANWAKIYHRDIKPANIFLKDGKFEGTKQVVAMLADFGCAQSDEWTWQMKPEMFASRASAHTPGFDQPEYPLYTGASDVWQMALVWVCISGLEGKSPRSKINAGGVQWDENRPAGPRYSEELSSVLKWYLTVDAKARPNALAASKRLKNTYAGIKNRLPPDDQPLEVFDDCQGQSSPAPQPGPVQAPKRPAPPDHVMSDPGAGRFGQQPSMPRDMGGGPRSPQGPFPSGHPLGRFPNSLDEMLEHGQADPRFFGGPHQHPGYFPPFHPRESSRRGRRRF